MRHSISMSYRRPAKPVRSFGPFFIRSPSGPSTTVSHPPRAAALLMLSAPRVPLGHSGGRAPTPPVAGGGDAARPARRAARHGTHHHATALARPTVGVAALQFYYAHAVTPPHFGYGPCVRP